MDRKQVLSVSENLHLEMHMANNGHATVAILGSRPKNTEEEISKVDQ